jgi:N-acetylglucosaminyldiphosphoundecaprenol N-acetyl-beta-D-mannosaminyltransferase
LKIPNIRIFGLPISKLSFEKTVDLAYDFLSDTKPHIIFTPNPEILMSARNETDEMHWLLSQADLLTPDGIGVVYASKIMGNPIKERVPGFDTACALLERIQDGSHSLYLLGGKPGVAEQAAENIRAKYPNIKILGTHDGYFVDTEPIVTEIAELSPDLLFVCLGSPKQERFAVAYRNRLNCKLMMGLGGSLDVFAGTVKRAPVIFQKLGLEWFYRLCKQPSRFARMLSLPHFALIIIKDRILKGRVKK